MFCPKCGKELENGAAFCGYCGASIPAQPQHGSYRQQSGSYVQQPFSKTVSAASVNRQSVSKKEYIENYAPYALRKNIKNIAIVCYGLAAISAVSSIALTGSFMALIDVVVFVGITLGMHLGKSKICAILLLIFSIGECVLTTIMLGMFSGWWWIVLGILAVSTFVKLDKQYNIFLAERASIPTAPASPQPFAPIVQPVQPPVNTDVYYTPSQPAEPETIPEQPTEQEATPEQSAAPVEEAPAQATESID